MTARQAVRQLKRLLAMAKPPVDIVRRIEDFAWAKPWWKFRADRYDRILDELVDRKDDLSDRREFNRIDVLSKSAHERVMYTRELKGKMPEIRTQLEEHRFSDIEIRDVVVGRLMRKDGRPRLAAWRKYLVFFLVVVWHAIATISIVLLALLVLVLPGYLIVKVLVLTVLFTFYLECFGIMHSICFRAVSMWDRYREFSIVNNTNGSRSTS